VNNPVSLQDRIEQVEQRIRKVCEHSGRRREDIQLIAVTKYVSLETTRAVLDQGIEQIGENRWQDAKEKWESLGQRGIVKDILGRFHWIHSLDRLSLAKEIEKRAARENKTVPCLVQLNVSGEESKYGLDPEKLFQFVEEVSEMKHIELGGLMTMAPFVENPEETRPVFRELRILRDRLQEKYGDRMKLEHLSMGMSNDFEIAIEEGATMLRLGSVLVGRE
jgi:pyridoxal phosphate enzyme (YggS family)